MRKEASPEEKEEEEEEEEEEVKLYFRSHSILAAYTTKNILLTTKILSLHSLQKRVSPQRDKNRER